MINQAPTGAFFIVLFSLEPITAHCLPLASGKKLGVYQSERRRGGHCSYKRSVATATNNVHLVAGGAQITRPLNGDLDF